MLNLYKHAISPDSFLGLVANRPQSDAKILENNNRRIFTGFAVLSLLILSVIADGSQHQLGFGIESHTEKTFVA
ncbi:MAG: hypothetical protein KDF58_06150 [Alphaproteobacteria bacterium]|nr:hypothetical protein [Alphaproteobacteria bacterium]HPF47457.1 hypothetical protein [Emcibacteraceae bacterium]